MPKLIAMLTHNDVTTPDALERFLEAKDAPCDYWGSKDVGISEDEMRRLADAMRENGKRVFMESLAYSEKDTLKSLRTAEKCGVEYVLGGTYYKSAAEFANCSHIRILPFIGLRNAGRLYGDMDEMIAYTRERATRDVFGINISAYRYDGDCDLLTKRVVAAIDKPVSIAGSINSYDRLAAVKETGCWAFTVGGAFYENRFGEGFSAQIEAVSRFLSAQ